LKINWLTSTLVEKNQAGVINMKKIINFLLNKKILLIIASILALLFTLAFVISHFNGFVFYWDDYFWFAYSIAVIFTVANYTPSLVLYLIEIHQNNLEDIKEQELEEIK
jgi:hypothetical protein